MADLSQPLDQILTAQSQKEVTANELFDALSPSGLYGRRASTSSGLTHGYNGGRFNSTLITPGTVSLTDNATNYVVVLRSSGAVSVSTSVTNWNDTTNYLRTYLYTTVSGAVTVREDHRQSVGGAGAGGTFTGGTLTSALNEAPIVTIASAGTVNIGAAAANTISISGTTTITAFDSIADGARRLLYFQGALTLTHNATSLILPTGANITTAAGDTAEALSLGSGNWRITSYQRKDGTALSASAGSAAGSDTQIQYNNAGAFGGSARLTWVNSTRTFSVNDGLDATGSVIQSPAQTASNTAGQQITFRSGAGLGSGNGGAMAIQGGAGGTTGTGGPITLTGGAAGGTATGGTITLNAGATAGVANGAGITLQCAAGGSSGGVTGGAFIFTAGAGNIGGGMVFTTGATSAAGTAGGNIRFVMGAPGAGGTYGQIRWELDDATRRGTFHGAGNVNIGPTTSIPTVKFLVEGSTSVTATSQSASGTTTINLATTNVHKIAMGTNITTLTVSNPTDCQEVTIWFTQDGTGSRTIAWPSSFKWEGGTVPVLSTPAASVDLYTGIYNSTTGFYYGRLEKAFA